MTREDFHRWAQWMAIGILFACNIAMWHWFIRDRRAENEIITGAAIVIDREFKELDRRLADSTARAEYQRKYPEKPKARPEKK